VTLILYYVAFMIGGDFAAYFLGLLVEYEWGKHQFGSRQVVRHAGKKTPQRGTSSHAGSLRTSQLSPRREHQLLPAEMSAF
jgi:hypothetical protein